MNETALIATDLSAASEAVAGCGANLKQLGIHRIILTQCIGSLPAASMAFNYDTNMAGRALAAEKQILEDSGLAVETEIIDTTKAKAIDHLAAEKKAGLVVFGSHSQSLLHELIAGGLVRNLSLHSQLPLLVLPLTKTDSHSEEICVVPGSCDDLMQHIMFPTDFSENADLAFSAVEELAGMKCGKITLFHVQDAARIEPHLTDKLDEFNRIDTARLQALADRLAKTSDVPTEIEVNYGRPVSEILKTAEDRAVSLIVMGTHGRDVLPEAHLGSVSQAIIRNSRIPMLLIPSQL